MKVRKFNQEQCIEQGKRLRKCLEVREIKQKDFASMCGFTPQYVSNMIRGKGIAAENISAFADLLNVSREYLSLESDYMSFMDEIRNDLDRQNKIDNKCIDFLDALGYVIKDDPSTASFYQIKISKYESDQDILQRAKEAREREKTQFKIITPSGKRKLISRQDLLRLLAEMQAFSRTYMETRIGK